MDTVIIKLTHDIEVPSLGIEKDLVHNNLNIRLDSNGSFRDLDVASCEVVITTNCQPYITNGTDNNAALYSTAVETILSEYDTFIRCMPHKWCCSCGRCLFPKQVRHIGHAKTNALITSLNLDSCSDLCCTCQQYLTTPKIPSIWNKPFSLNSSLYDTCSSVRRSVCWKGLVVDLPRDVHTVVDRSLWLLWTK